MLGILIMALPIFVGLFLLCYWEYEKPRPDLPPKEYPYEPIADRIYRRDIVPLFQKHSEIVRSYYELRNRQRNNIPGVNQ